MIYPVKLEFKIYPLGAWEDWSIYLSEPPSINRKVESENPGEAGLIVFDNASVSLYYDEGSSVYAAFQEPQLVSAQRYLFRISLPKSDKTYVQVFEGMADFSTIEWPDKSRLISFDIIDKLSAISLVGSGGAREKTVDVWERCGSYDPAAYQIAISRGGAAGNYRRFYVDIVDRGYPEYSDCSENAFLPGEVIEYNGEYCQIVSFQLVSTGAGIDPYDGHPTYYYGRGVITALHTAAFPEIPDVPYGFKIYGSLFAGRNINVIENGSLTSFDAFEIIAGLMNLAWEGTQVINRIGDGSFKLPVEYFAQLMSGSLFNKQPLDALKMLADSMQAYIFFDKNGSLVIQKKISLAVNEATCSFGNTRVIDASKKYFWDKLIDGVTITVQGWTLKNGETLVGKSALAKTNPETGGLVKPKNELSKDVLGGDPGLTTQEALDAAALQMASSYMNFYGSRHNCREYDLDLDDNTLSWDLLDNILIETEKFFFESINIDPAESKVSVKLVGVQEHDYDLRQVVVGLSSQAYTASSAGGSYSSGGTSYTGNPYLWDGGAIGLDAAKARTNLGLQNILNIGEGIIGNTEFNALDGVTSNIQTQLNSKENVLTFVGPLVRSGQQISFSYNASNLKIISGSLNTIQDINPSATPQFNGIYAGFADLADGLLLSGVALADSVRNVYAARIGIGGDPDFTDYVFKTYGNGYFTGNLFVNGPARAERLGLGTDVDASLSLKTAAGAYINGNLTVVGNIYQSGTAYLVDAQHLQVESNIIYVNKNEAGNGVTNGIAGIEVERGTGTNYQFMFQESDDTFRLGMAGSLQAAATRQDSPISQGVAYWNNTVYRFDTSSNLKFDGTHLSVGGAALTDALNVRGNILQDINYKYSSLGYFSGWGNKGFELNTDASGVSNFIVDNLTVRRTMSVYELLIRQIRATNGSVYVTAATRFKNIALTNSSSAYTPDTNKPTETITGALYICTLDNDDSNAITFAKNDIIIMQIWSGRSITASWGIITDVSSNSCTILYIGGSGYSNPEAAHTTAKGKSDWVRIGNLTDTMRQGSVFITADDDGAPFIDVRDGVNSFAAWGSSSTKVRLGKMAGIAGNPWGNQNVYGLYADVAWLTDNVVIGGRSLGLMQGLTALFHFDDNDYDSISGIKPSYTGTKNESTFGLVSSSDNNLVYTKVNGKFGGGVAVEEATTNLITNGGFEAGGSTGYSWWGSGTRSIVNGYHGSGYYMESTSSAVGLSSSAIAAVSGTTYAIQVKVKGDHLNYFYILKASGNVNISTLATKTYLEGGWYQLTYTLTCTTTETWNILFAFYNYAKGVIDEAQVEAKAYATSFVEGSRPIGIIEYNVPYFGDFTIAYYLPSEYKPYNSIRNFLEAYSPEGYSMLIRNGYNNDFQIEGSNVSGTYASGWSAMTGLPYANPGSNWNNAFVVIRKTGPAVKAGIFYNGVFYERAEYINAGLNFLINKIKISRGTGTGRFVIDELMMFNRSLSNDEIKRIYFSNQPLRESPGMTYISGNKIRTGYIYSENWKSLQTGMMIGLNSAYMEMNFAEKNVFMFDSASATASIAGWGFTYDRLSKITANNKAIYLISASDTTDLFGLQIDLQYGGSLADKPKWLSVGRIRRGQTVTDNYGFGIFDKDGYPYFESSISAVDNSVTNIMAGWKINSSAIWVGGTAPATDGAYAASGMTLGSAGYLSTPNTYITSSGIFYTKSANIAGWSIDASAIYSGTRGANGAYTTSGMTIGSAGYISSPNTFISSSGVLYSKSGNIAGYSFDAGKFYVSTDFVLDAANKKWYFANKSTYATTTAGIFMGLDAGVYKVNIGGPTNNIKWTGTALEINGGSLTSANITGATITGSTVQTAASGQRVVLDGATNKLKFLGPTGSNCGDISGDMYMRYNAVMGHVFDQHVSVNNGHVSINDEAYRYGWNQIEQPVYHGARVGNNVTIPPEPANPRVGDLDWENNTSLATKKMRMYTPDGWKTITFS